VQVVWSSRRGSRAIEHLGPAHDEAELEALKAAAQQRIAAGQLELALGLEPACGGPLPITFSLMGHLLDALEHAYRVPGLEDAAGGDDVFRHLALARIIEPVSKLDSLRALEGGRGRADVVRDGQAPPAGLCGGGVAAAAVGGLRRARRPGAGQPGPLPRVHALLRDRPGRRVPRAGLLQGAPAWSPRSPSAC